MSELRDRMIQDMKLAGLVEGTRREYLRAVHQLAAYYMLAPDQLSELIEGSASNGHVTELSSILCHSRPAVRPE